MNNNNCNKCKKNELQPIKTNCSNANNNYSFTESYLSTFSENNCCDDIDQKITNIIESIDNQISNNNDFIQNQVNLLNNSYIEIINELKTENNRYQVVINEINNINETLDEFKINNVNCCKPSNCNHNCCCGKIVYTDVTKIHIFVVEIDIQFVYITGVGGGGSSGISCISGMYYISASGGNSSEGIIRRPYKVTIGTIIKISLGKGGDINDNPNGTDTIIEITRPDKTKETIIIKGGKHGNPLNCEFDVSPSIPEDSDNCFFPSCLGQPGNISLPSYICAVNAIGGASLLFSPGKGGNSLLYSKSNIELDGKYGSGGSANLPSTNRIAGKGGDSLVIIEW